MKKLILILAIVPFLTACPWRKGPPPAPAAVTEPQVEKIDAEVAKAIAKLEAQAAKLTTIEERTLFALKIAEEIDRLTSHETPAPTPLP